MDNLCHSLVGMALGRAGLNRRTALATSTLVIANNLPDIDVGVFATNTLAMSFRRGWTHGVLAQLTLPIVLTGAMLLYDRYYRKTSSPRGSREARPTAAAVVSRRAAPRVHGLHQQLRRPAADAVLGALVLRRCALHRRSLALPVSRARLVAGEDAAASGAHRRGARGDLRGGDAAVERRRAPRSGRRPRACRPARHAVSW